MRSVADGDRLASGGRHEGPVSTVALSVDGTMVASGGLDRTIRLWDAANLSALRILLGHTEPVRALAFSGDGARLASAGDDLHIRVWEAGTFVDRSVLRGHTSYVYPVAFSPKGDWLASASWDGTVRIWPVIGGVPHVVETNMQSPLGLLWHPRCNLVVVYGLNKQSRYGCEVIGFDRDRIHGKWGEESTEFCPVGFVNNSATVVVKLLNNLSEICEWNITDEGTRIEKAQSGWLNEVSCPNRVGDLSVLFVSSESSKPEFQIVDSVTNDVLWKCEPTTSRTFAMEPICSGRSRIAIISPTNPRDILIRDLRTGDLLETLRGHTDEALALAWSPDGSRLASAGRDRLIRVWDAKNWLQLAQLGGHTSYVWSLAFSPDGTLLASGSGDKTVRLWRIVRP